MLSSMQPRMLWSPLQPGVLLVGAQLAAHHTPGPFHRAALWPVSPQPGSPPAWVQGCAFVPVELLLHLARPYQPHLDTAILWETVSPCPQLYNRSHFIIVISFHCYEIGIDKAQCLRSTFARVHTQDTACMLP